MQRSAACCLCGWLPPSGPSDSDLAGHQLQRDPGPFRAAAPDLAFHFRGGSSQGGRGGPPALPFCHTGPFGSWKDHLHGHPVWPQAGLRSAHIAVYPLVQQKWFSTISGLCQPLWPNSCCVFPQLSGFNITPSSHTLDSVLLSQLLLCHILS